MHDCRHGVEWGPISDQNIGIHPGLPTFVLSTKYRKKKKSKFSLRSIPTVVILFFKAYKTTCNFFNNDSFRCIIRKIYCSGSSIIFIISDLFFFFFAILSSIN